MEPDYGVLSSLVMLSAVVAPLVCFWLAIRNPRFTRGHVLIATTAGALVPSVLLLVMWLAEVGPGIGTADAGLFFSFGLIYVIYFHVAAFFMGLVLLVAKAALGGFLSGKP